MFFTKILTFLSGGILDRVFSHLEKREEYKNADSRIKAEIVKEAISAEIETRKVMNEQIRIENGWWVTRYIRPAFAYPLAVYYGAIIADSIFQFSWNVAAMPETMLTWSGIIITFFFGGRTIERVASIWTSRNRR